MTACHVEQTTAYYQSWDIESGWDFIHYIELTHGDHSRSKQQPEKIRKTGQEIYIRDQDGQNDRGYFNSLYVQYSLLNLSSMHGQELKTPGSEPNLLSLFWYSIIADTNSSFPNSGHMVSVK